MIEIQKLLGGRCNVVVLERQENKQTGRIENMESTIFENIPCHFISTQSSSYVKKGYAPTLMHKGILIFDKNIQIPLGSKITVTQNGDKRDYAFSGVPTVYSSHREIPVAIFERWI